MKGGDYMKKIVSLIMVILFMCIIVGCSTHLHTIGNGAQGVNEVESRQWYILFGLVPLNDTDTKEMAAGAVDYNVKTQQSALDVLMNMLTMWVTINSRTVTVTK